MRAGRAWKGSIPGAPHEAEGAQEADARYTISMGELRVRSAYQAALQDAGIATPAHVLGQSECLRELPDRSNHRLVIGDLVVFVKRRKPRGWWRGAPINRELEGCEEAARLGIPVAPIVFSGSDPRLGALVGHAALAPARPLDDLLREAAFDDATHARVFDDLAAHVAALHDGGRHHRDLYLNHVFVDPQHAEPVRGIIDWERSGPHGRPWGRWVVKDLAALRASAPRDAASGAIQRAFLERYASARQVPYPRDLDHLAARVERKAARIRAHVPRTPVGPDAPKPGALA